jgi:hypothetical protein
MSGLRFASLLTLAVWVGGIAVLGGISAPALFSVLEARDPTGGRALAGELFGEIFLRFQHLAWLLGGALVALLITRRMLGPRPRPFAIRLSAASAMLALSLVGGLVLAPRIDAIRRETRGAIAALDDADARKIEFGRLHGLSNALMGVTLVVGVGLLWLEMRDPH